MSLPSAGFSFHLNGGMTLFLKRSEIGYIRAYYEKIDNEARSSCKQAEASQYRKRRNPGISYSLQHHAHQTHF